MTQQAYSEGIYWTFRKGVLALAQGDRPLKERILFGLNAYGIVLPDELPPAIKETWLELKAHTTWNAEGDPSRGTWANTLDTLEQDDLRRIAQLMIRLFELASRFLPVDRVPD